MNKLLAKDLRDLEQKYPLYAEGKIGKLYAVDASHLLIVVTEDATDII